MNKIKMMFGFIMVAFLSGCQTTTISGLAGMTPVTLNNSVYNGFQRYLKDNAGRAFAITINGNNYFSAYCDYSRCTYGGKTAPLYVVDECELKGTSKCKLFAVRKNIVWAGPISYPDQNLDEKVLSVTIPESETSSLMLTGKAKININKTTAILDIKIHGENCRGNVYFVKETWQLTCNAKTYKGTISPSSDSLYWGQSHDKTLTLTIN